MILKLEALIKRMPEMEQRREKVKSELNKRNAGYKGEQKLDYYLSFLDEKEYRIFHGLRLMNGKHYFQIDTLLVTRKMAFILEIKNWNGTIIFDPEFHQLIRVQNDKQEAFHDPISQAEHQSLQLRKWLKEHGFTCIPIEYAVIISSPSTIIKSPTNQISNQVFHAHRLINKITSIENTHNAERLTEKELKKLSKTLLKKHVSQEIDILEYFNIKSDTILTGVYCPKCSALPMIFHWGKWRCPACRTSSAIAHHQAVNDYFLLCNPIITNTEFRRFTHITSVYTASKLLAQMDLEQGGEKKNRVYKKPVNEGGFSKNVNLAKKLSKLANKL
ncbi:nuclease-related domain-containing protein [Cytobacillus oceanisediminis]|nr:nuclease-related domain-containing protein [Cytobacillus oceanisediminis]